MAEVLALLIPILALSIPIVAIFANSPIGKALAERVRNNSSGSPEQTLKIQQLEQRIRQLEDDSLSQSQELQVLEQNYTFLSRLLEDKRENTT